MGMAEGRVGLLGWLEERECKRRPRAAAGAPFPCPLPCSVGEGGRCRRGPGFSSLSLLRSALFAWHPTGYCFPPSFSHSRPRSNSFHRHRTRRGDRRWLALSSSIRPRSSSPVSLSSLPMSPAGPPFFPPWFSAAAGLRRFLSERVKQRHPARALVSLRFILFVQPAQGQRFVVVWARRSDVVRGRNGYPQQGGFDRRCQRHAARSNVGSPPRRRRRGGK